MNRIVVVCGWFLVACKGSPDRSVGVGSPAPLDARGQQVQAPPPSPPSRLTCVDLPGAQRDNLQVSADGKRAYYTEQGQPIDDEMGEPPLDLYEFDLALRTTKLLVRDVGTEVSVAPNGTVVFTRAAETTGKGGEPRRVVMVMAPGGDATAITKGLEGLRGLALDRATGTIVYEQRNDNHMEVWKAQLPGGTPQKVSSTRHYFLIGVTEGSALLSNGHRLARQPLVGGAMVDLADLDEHFFGGVVQGQAVLLSKKDRKVSLAPLTSAAKPLPFEFMADARSLTQGAQVYAIGKIKNTYEVHALAAANARPLLALRGRRPVSVASIANQLLVLAQVDSNGDGDFGGDDEVDLCVAAPGPDPIDALSRSIPKRFVGLDERLRSKTLTGPLAGARLQLISDRWIHVIIPTLPTGAMAEDLGALVTRTQQQVAEVLPDHPAGPVSINLRVEDTGQRAVSRWHRGAGMFLVTKGVGTAQLADRAQYLIEASSKVMYAGGYSSNFGDVTCHGTIKNIGDHELTDLEVACARSSISGYREVRAKLKPDKLAPGATGSYRLALGYAIQGEDFTLSVFSSSKRLPYYHTHGVREATRIIAAATKVHASTQLAYLHMVSRPSANFRSTELRIYVRAPKALEEGPVDDLERAAKKALALFKAEVPRDPRLYGVPKIVIFRSDQKRIGWTYFNGKLTTSEPS